MKLKDACSLEEKLLTNLDSTLKSRDITLPTKVCLVKAMVFPVVTYGCESWTIEKAERQSIDAFDLWCWRRLWRVPWTARRSNQSILKETSPECSLQGLMLKLKLQHFGHLMQRTDSFEKTLMLGKIAGRGRRERQSMRWLDGIINAMGMSLSKLRNLVMDVLQSTGLQRVRHDWATGLDWTVPCLWAGHISLWRGANDQHMETHLPPCPPALSVLSPLEETREGLGGENLSAFFFSVPSFSAQALAHKRSWRNARWMNE